MIPLDPNQSSGTNPAVGGDTAFLGRHPAVPDNGVPFPLPTPRTQGAVAPHAGRTGGPGLRAAGEEDR